MILYLLLLVLLLSLCIFFVFFVLIQIIAAFNTDAPFVPIPKGLEYEIVENLGLDKNSILYDLGCGDGRVLVEASREYPEIKAVGIEIAHWPFILAKYKSFGFKNIKIKRENIFTTDISDATHIFLYLYPEVISKLILNIKQQCRPGTIIISCDFEIANMKPESILQTKNTSSPTRGKKLLVYKI